MATNATQPILSPQTPESDDNVHALYSAFLMIIVSEIGDKTFLIAALLAMRHPRFQVLLGALSSLIVMSILSAGMGHALPSLLVSRRWTQAAAATLFLVFGVKMVREAMEMESGTAKVMEELREVEEELEMEEGGGAKNMEEGRPRASGNGNGNIHADDDEFKRPSIKRSAASSVNAVSSGARNLVSLCLGPVFVQSFILTFLGEWGDRSQIATIALGAAHNPYIIAVGTIIGHSICTTMAVIGGRWLSTKISVKHVTAGGASLFLLFSVIYFYEAWIDEPSSTNGTGSPLASVIL